MKGFGRGARYSIGIRTVLGTGLAVGAAFLVVDLARDTYARWDTRRCWT
jgi:hypothetical protein